MGLCAKCATEIIVQADVGTVVKWGVYRAATNVTDTRKALEIQACPGIGRVRVQALRF